MTGQGEDQGRGRVLFADPTDPRPVPPELLADLYETAIVITPGYVGADRRRVPRPSQDPRPSREPPARQRASRCALTVLTVLVTAAAVIPLTLIGVHPASSAPAPPAAVATAPLRSASPERAAPPGRGRPDSPPQAPNAADRRSAPRSGGGGPALHRDQGPARAACRSTGEHGMRPPPAVGRTSGPVARALRREHAARRISRRHPHNPAQ